MDYELLKKRREKYLKLQRELGEEQHIGLGYVLTVEGKQYPVMSCFLNMAHKPEHLGRRS